MLLGLPILVSTILCLLLSWSSRPNPVHAFIVVDRGRAFESKSRFDTELQPHRFNGGYDPASPLTWTPQQAAEFTLFHEGMPQHAGMQLRTTIQHWSGADVAEFLTRLYLGCPVSIDSTNNGAADTNTNKVVYEPHNVRSPQWKGLDTREGILALKDLLKESLSEETLSAQEISRFGEEFLLKEYRWPIRIPQSNSTSNNVSILSSKLEVVFERDSFYSLGHAQTIARVLLAVRKERGYNEFTWNDIAMMVTLPEKRDEDREAIPMKMIDFFRTISAYTTLTAMDKANIVQRMAISGWLARSIPKFMAELYPTESLNENHSVDEIWRLQGDAFFDFPSAATLVETNANKEKRNASTIDIAVAKVAKVVGKERSAPPSKRPRDGERSVGSEYEDLVQSYWKKVEVSNTKTKKKPIKEYGVAKTKSIKKRRIPDNFLATAKADNCLATNKK